MVSKLFFGSQFSTIPVEESDVVVSPVKKLFLDKIGLKVGKYFCGIILPDELVEL